MGDAAQRFSPKPVASLSPPPWTKRRSPTPAAGRRTRNPWDTTRTTGGSARSHRVPGRWEPLTGSEAFRSAARACEPAGRRAPARGLSRRGPLLGASAAAEDPGQDQQPDDAEDGAARPRSAPGRGHSRTARMRRRCGKREFLSGEDIVWLGDPGRIIGQRHGRVADARIGRGERELLSGEHIVRRQTAGIPSNRGVAHAGIFPDPAGPRFANPLRGQQ